MTSLRFLVSLMIVLAYSLTLAQIGVLAAGPDFTISANPSSVAITPGPQGNSTITVASQSGFAGRVNMTLTVYPAGIYCQLNETSLNIPTNGSNSSLLHCGGNPGTFTVTVTGAASISGGVVTHTSNAVTYIVADFSIATNPTSVSFITGHSGTTTITISSQQTFNNRIYLNLTLPAGINGSISPYTLPGVGSATLNLNSTVVGSYNVTIIAASGGISHKAYLLVTVTNQPAPFPTSLYLYAGIGGIIVAAGVASIVLYRRGRPGRGTKAVAKPN